MKIQNSSTYGKRGGRESVWEMQLALNYWLGRDVSTWSANRIRAVYNEEKTKRNKIFYSQLYD
jgi:hypothetical protein